MGLDEQNSKIIIYSLLAALYCLQKKDIAHCDLKLENILVSFDQIPSVLRSSKNGDKLFLNGSNEKINANGDQELNSELGSTSDTSEVTVNEKPIIKIIDFGLAQTVKEEIIIQKGSEPYLVISYLIF